MLTEENDVELSVGKCKLTWNLYPIWLKALEIEVLQLLLASPL